MSMTVATFNTRHGRPLRGLARNDLLVRQCSLLDADVLALQELDRRVVRSYLADQPHRIAQALGMQVAWAPARRPLLVGNEGNALLVRGTLRDVSIIELPHSPRRYRRNAILAQATVDGAEPRVGGIGLSVAATHLHNHPPTAARQLPVLLGHLARLPEPRVLLGDLNMPRTQAVPMLTDAGYEVADGGPTVPAKAPEEQIDFVAMRGLAIASAVVHPTLVSDHHPLVVTTVSGH